MDVVVPYRGDAGGLRALIGRLAALELGGEDTLLVADNSGAGSPRDGLHMAGSDGVLGGERLVRSPSVVDASARPGSYFARNRGAERGAAPWIVFLDADVEPEPGLVDAYFSVTPGERTAVLVGSVVDEAPAGERATRASRWAHARGLMSQDRTSQRAEWAYAQTANCAVRREAFTAVGGFTEGIRSGGDADLCFRLREAGWQLEARDDARVTHRSRLTLRALLRQRVRVGAGAAWLEARYPGFMPRRPLARVLAGDVRQLLRGNVLDGLTDAAFQVGARLGNRPRGHVRR